MMAVGGNRPLPELLLGVSQRPYGVLKYCWGLFYASRWRGSTALTIFLREQVAGLYSPNNF